MVAGDGKKATVREKEGKYTPGNGDKVVTK